MITLRSEKKLKLLESIFSYLDSRSHHQVEIKVSELEVQVLALNDSFSLDDFRSFVAESVEVVLFNDKPLRFDLETSDSKMSVTCFITGWKKRKILPSLQELIQDESNTVW